MKTDIISTAISTLLLSTAAFGSNVLMDAKTFKLNLKESTISVSDVKAELKVTCEFETGFFWHERKSCGYATTKISVESTGTIAVPQVLKFNQSMGQDSDNYSAVLVLSQKSMSDNTYIGLVDVIGSDGISEYAKLDPELSVISFKAAKLPLTINGQPVVGSELSKTDDLSLSIDMNTAPEDNYRSNARIVSPFDSYTLLLTNYRSVNPGHNKDDLAKATDISIEPLHLLYQGNPDQIKPSVRIVIRNARTKLFDTSVQLQMSADALSEISSSDLELKPTK